jgi:hypothetical protein
MNEEKQEPLSEEERKIRWDHYCKYHDKAVESITASSDEFDKSLLTYSSGALGLSLAFIKDIVKLENAIALSWLYWSWLFLVSCIVLTIASYRLSIHAQQRRLDDARRFYMEKDEKALNRETVWSRMLDLCAYFGAAFFLAGVLSTVLFVYFNVSQEHKMPPIKVTEGRAPLSMTPTMNTLERGRAPLPMTPTQTQGTVPAAQPSQSISAPAAPTTPLKKD